MTVVSCYPIGKMAISLKITKLRLTLNQVKVQIGLPFVPLEDHPKGGAFNGSVANPTDPLYFKNDSSCSVSVLSCENKAAGATLKGWFQKEVMIEKITAGGLLVNSPVV